MPRTQDDSSSMPRTRGIGYQFGVHLSHKITPLPPVENFPIVIGLRCIVGVVYVLGYIYIVRSYIATLARRPLLQLAVAHGGAQVHGALRLLSLCSLRAPWSLRLSRAMAALSLLLLLLALNNLI